MGVAGDAITTTETMANGSFGAATLENGVDGTAGTPGYITYDASYMYICVGATEWKRVSIATF